LQYSSLQICTETDISGVGSLRAIVLKEFEGFWREKQASSDARPNAPQDS